MIDGRRLSGTVGPVLDPVFALRRRLRIPAGGTARIAFWTMVAAVARGAARRRRQASGRQCLRRAPPRSPGRRRRCSCAISTSAPAQASLYQRLAGHVLYANPALRSSSDTIRRGLAPPPALWAQGISGDLPIVLVRIDEVEDAGIVRELLRAHEYWRLKRLAVDLVILNERGASYVQDLQVALETLVRTSQSRPISAPSSEQGGVFVLRSDLISAETRALLHGAGARRAARPARQPGRPARPPADAARRAVAAARAGRAPRRRLRRSRRRSPAAGAICSSSTAWAASRPTAAST